MDWPAASDLYDNPDLAQIYESANRRGDEFEFCMKLAGDGASNLDLSCGTGAFDAAMAGNRVVTGVNPAEAMLDIAQLLFGQALSYENGYRIVETGKTVAGSAETIAEMIANAGLVVGHRF